MASLEKTSLAKVLCENGDRIDRIPRNVFLNAMYPRDYVPCPQIEDVNLEPWRGCCKENMDGPNASKRVLGYSLIDEKLFLHLVCNSPAILSFDPFPNYRPSSIDTVTRHKREAIEEDDREHEDAQKIAEKDQLDLKTLRKQVDEVLHKVKILSSCRSTEFFPLVCHVRSTIDDGHALL